MIPDYETLEHLARRARAERALYIAELIAIAVVAIDGALGKVWDRAASLLRSRPLVSRQAAQARR